MNETMKTILTRRSIRAYLPKQISEAELDTVLEAGTYAASAMNQQSCLFVVLQQGVHLDRLYELGSVLRGGGNPFYGAPTVVLVCAKKGNAVPYADACVAMDNLMLAAASIDLGSCWINCVVDIFAGADGTAFAKQLGIPDGYGVMASCALGYRAGPNPEAPPRKEGFVLRPKA